MKRKRVLITGGAGYLGNVLSRDLLNHDYSVTCVDNLMYGQTGAIFPLATNKNFNFVFGDVRNEDLMKKLIQSQDVIIPLAAIVGAPACDKNPVDTKTINYGAIDMLNRLRSKDQKLICPITNSGYGTKSGEEYCTEESPLEPISLYGQTKVDAEKILLESDKDAISLRLATVFGISPRMRTDLLVNDFVYKAITDGYLVIYEGKFKRNFVHVQDVARAFEHSIENYDTMKNQAYNVGLDSANISKLELAEKVKKQIPRLEIYISENGSDPDKRNYIVSNEKIRRAGFEASITLDEGIKELIRGYEILTKRNPYKNI